MDKKRKVAIIWVLVMSLLLSSCGATQSYSNVINSYPQGTELCNRNVLIGINSEGLSQDTNVGTEGNFPTFTRILLNVHIKDWTSMYALVTGEFTIENGASILDSDLFASAIHCYGVKITLNSTVTLDGKEYKAGTLLTVNKNKKLIAVSSWQ